MDKIKKMSGHIKSVLTVFLGLVVLFVVIKWVMIGLNGSKSFAPVLSSTFDKAFISPEGVVTLLSRKWSGTALFFGFMGDIVGLIPFVTGLIFLRLLFDNYSKGLIFNSDNARQFRKLGTLLFLYALVAQPISYMFTMLGLTFTNPVGHRYIVLQLGSVNVYTLFLGVMLSVISWVMIEAGKLHDEQKFIV
ncbi:MAG: hypothetical protein S4CHLAM20_11500 [Chlamydiia bacterium]|nr:hypothetical protein [Chlamydiia bacterium]